jgi:hypothetical protein
MLINGNLLKLKTILKDTVDYYLLLDGKEYGINKFIGNNVKITFQHKINCINCGKSINKTFFQGYCFNCFNTLPQTDIGVINPELNRAHEGVSRDMEWSKKYDLTEHYVYLSVTNDIKVGVTRHTQIPTRWIDQGAEYAIILAQTPYRQLAGMIEVELKQYLNDKTNWRKMLTSGIDNVPDLLSLKEYYANKLPEEYFEFISDNDTITHIKYPIIKYPNKVRSINLNKKDTFEGKLIGIKGQYLIFDDNSVLNIRKYSGYNINFEFNE